MLSNPFPPLESQNYNYGTISTIPVAEQNQTYFAYFDGVGGSGPEYIDGTSYFIKYLIDLEGNVVNPEPYTVIDSPQAVGLYNLVDNFEPGKNAVVKLIETNPLLDEIPNSEILQGTHKIAHVGRIVPILVTETGENVQDYIATMSFGPTSTQQINTSTLSGSFIPNLNFKLQYKSAVTPERLINTLPNGDFNIPNSQNVLRPLFYNLITEDNSSWDWNGIDAELTILSSSADTGTRIRFKITTYIEIQPVDWGGDNDDYHENSWRLGYKKNDDAITWGSYGWIWNKAEGPASQRSGYKTFTTPWIDNYTEEDKFIFYAGAATYTEEKHLVYRGTTDTTGTILIVEQETPPGNPEEITTVELINSVNAIYSPFFVGVQNRLNSIIVGPDGPATEEVQALFNYSYILMSPSASALWESGLTQNLDPTSSLMGFSPINVPFSNIRPGDFIRFEYKKDQIYTILDVVRDFVPNNQQPDNTFTAIKVTPNIGMGFNGVPTLDLNHFVIYRVINDGTYVTLDVKKDAPGGIYSGILQPEFVSKELVQKYDKIIQSLTEKEIIQ
jgi:hypothetical protein